VRAGVIASTPAREPSQTDSLCCQTREEKVPNRTIHWLAALALLAGLPAGAAGAAEIKAVIAVALRPAMQELVPAFEKASGHKVSIEYATAGKVAEKVAGEDTIDVAILTKPLSDKAVRAAKLVGGTTTQLAQQQIGLAVKKGAAKPDISSLDAFKKTLAGAKSIAMSDPADGGAASIFLMQQFDKLGIAGEIKPKLKLVKAATGQGGTPAAEAVQRGEAEITIVPISLLMGVQGIDIVGPLPAELQSPDLTFVAGTPWTCEEPIAAKAFIDFLKSDQAKAVYKAKGMTTS
jgi:molybdate transport system substrate-binding protein